MIAYKIVPELGVVLLKLTNVEFVMVIIPPALMNVEFLGVIILLVLMNAEYPGEIILPVQIVLIRLMEMQKLMIAEFVPEGLLGMKQTQTKTVLVSVSAKL